jgi:two-component system, LytTR family, sensor kinase
VPSFVIQHLVENAIRHGIARRPEAGRITIVARRVGTDLVVSVSDDGPGFDAETAARGGGIENTRERLRVLHGDQASLVVARGATVGTTATLRVPFRELPAKPDDGAR